MFYGLAELADWRASQHFDQIRDPLENRRCNTSVPSYSGSSADGVRSSDALLKLPRSPESVGARGVWPTERFLVVRLSPPVGPPALTALRLRIHRPARCPVSHWRLLKSSVRDFSRCYRCRGAAFDAVLDLAILGWHVAE